MSLQEQEQCLDDINARQPNILASVLVQQQMGNTLAEIDVLLTILLVIHSAFEEAGIQLATVSEQAQALHLAKYTGYLRSLEGLSETASAAAAQTFIDSHPEKNILAYVMGTMQKAGFMVGRREPAKYLLMTGINIVNCYAKADIVR